MSKDSIVNPLNIEDRSWFNGWILRVAFIFLPAEKVLQRSVSSTIRNYSESLQIEVDKGI
ncbi:MAG: hypothetical protein HXS48_06655 [Theionarchaea archaeon]|nr:hypothetical protein [Theionarchaea archaeon]